MRVIALVLLIALVAFALAQEETARKPLSFWARFAQHLSNNPNTRRITCRPPLCTRGQRAVQGDKGVCSWKCVDVEQSTFADQEETQKPRGWARFGQHLKPNTKRCRPILCKRGQHAVQGDRGLCSWKCVDNEQTTFADQEETQKPRRKWLFGPNDRPKIMCRPPLCKRGQRAVQGDTGACSWKCVDEVITRPTFKPRIMCRPPVCKIGQRRVRGDESKPCSWKCIDDKQPVSTLADELAEFFAETMSEQCPNCGAVNFAMSKVGLRYSQQQRLGPNSYDCSGLILSAYRAIGKSVPTTTSGYPGNLRKVTGDIQPGDILYKPGHVAMYAGNNMIVHAANERKGIETRDFPSYKAYIGYTAVYRP